MCRKIKSKKYEHHIVVGLTGALGTGKSTVCRMFQGLGAYVIDADREVHRLTGPNAPITRQIVKTFGRDILLDKTLPLKVSGRSTYTRLCPQGYKGIPVDNDALNREALAEVVFKDPVQLKKLCAIIHPPVLERIKELIDNAPSGIIIVDAPLLFEVGLNNEVDKTLVVSASRENQVSRLKAERGLSPHQIEERLKAQMPLAKKIELADFIIDNNGSVDATRSQVEKTWERLEKVIGDRR